MNGSNSADARPVFELLTPATLRSLRLPWLSRFNPDSLSNHLLSSPGMSLRVAGTNEYIIGERWRGRHDIANVLEVGARRHKHDLVEELGERVASGGVALLLVAEDVWRDEPGLYAGLGFGQIERIVFFERDLPARSSRSDQAWEEGVPLMRFERALLGDLALLMRLDHDSFPWLWWNEPDEMGSYMLLEDVSVYLAYVADEAVGYASFTMYNGWAHLDRLAVASSHQRKGYGASQLVNTLRIMQSLGARSVALSTQEHNVQSHRLYKRYGFRLGRSSMGIYGRMTGSSPQTE